jgi:steroid delta-isomerase-like uncharacterized protein
LKAEQHVQRYFEGWNNHDPAAIIATFADGGTYADPTTAGPLSGDAIGQNAAQLWAGFPDVRFEIANHLALPGGRFAAEWIMRGTNSGSFAGLPGTGRKVELKGADFIQADDSGIHSVQGYFDAGEIPRQLGLQTVVQPHALGPFTFGTSVRVGGQVSDPPGAFSVTSLVSRGEKDTGIVRNYSRQIALELPAMKGFLGWIGATIGERMVTVTAWRDPEDARQLMSGGKHLEATRAFYGPDLAAAGWTGIFAAHRINPEMSRCRECGTMNRRETVSMTHCKCGTPLPPFPSYW